MKKTNKFWLIIPAVLINLSLLIAHPTPKLVPSQCGGVASGGVAVNLLNYFNLQYISTAEKYYVMITNNANDSAEYYYASHMTSTNYPFVPKSYFPGLTHGRMYDVRVAAKINGSWTYGSPCVIRIDSNATVRAKRGDNFNVTTNVSVYPNPTNNDGFNINLTGLKEQSSKVTINVFDLFGKQVYAREVNHSGSELVTKVSPTTPLATGMYLVKIAVSGEVFNERIQVR